MGLRFRKSISIFPGVRLNFGKTGMSVSTGVPGFRRTVHISGKVTTSAGIPGTGIYYVDTRSPRSQPNRNSSRQLDTTTPQAQTTSRIEQSESGRQANYDIWDAYAAAEDRSRVENSVDEHVPLNHIHIEDETQSGEVRQIDSAALKSIHKASDDTIDWTEVLVSPVAPDDMYNQEMWSYYHSVASKVLSGDIDTYLQLIYEVNPLDDLLSYGGNFEFGTDDPQKIEVEFTINEAALSDLMNQMDRSAYNDLMQDYVCSVCIRIARDMFALLPISHTIVHSVLDGKTVVSVDFDRASLSKVKFGYIDPSETLSKFRHNMRFRVDTGFSSVPMID